MIITNLEKYQSVETFRLVILNLFWKIIDEFFLLEDEEILVNIFKWFYQFLSQRIW